MDKQSIQQTVRDYIQREFLRDEAQAGLTSSTALITGGVLDSISTIKLVSFLEQQYQVEFAAHEVSAEYLDSLETIADTVAGKLNKR
jgi:acyl carrier protein